MKRLVLVSDYQRVEISCRSKHSSLDVSLYSADIANKILCHLYWGLKERSGAGVSGYIYLMIILDLSVDFAEWAIFPYFRQLSQEEVKQEKLSLEAIANMPLISY